MTATVEVRVVTRAPGFPSTVLSNAVPGIATKVLNNWGNFEFHIPTLDAEFAAAIPAGRPLDKEIQVFRNGVCWWWGVPVSVDGDENWLTVRSYGLEWYFDQLYFGPQQFQGVQNGDFTFDLVAWTAVGCSASVDTSWSANGTKSARLVSTGAGADGYLGQWITVGPNAEATTYKAAAVARIDPNATFNTAYNERGLFLDRLVGSTSQQPTWTPITQNTVRDGTSVYLESPEVTVPAGQTQTLDLRLYAAGTVNWDFVVVRASEAVHTARAGEDVNTLLARILDYAQAGNQQLYGIGKTDLFITYAGTPTGKIVYRSYPYANNAKIWDALSEWPNTGVCDIGVTWNPAGTSRSFQIWPGGRGSLKSDVVLDFGGSSKIAKFSYTVDATQSASKPRAIGAGSGTTRAVGEAIDTLQTGRIILEKVLSPPPEVLPGSLADWAAGELARAKAPVKIPKLTTHENAGAVITNVDLGDRVPVQLNYGWVQENDNRRIVALAWDPVGDTLEPTLNV